jgi:hypothetical protein
LAALVVAAFLFPVNIPALFARGASAPSELASIGEDLQGLGERLEEASRAQDLGRRLALSQELAQLGSELADRTITSDEALDRISDLEGRVAREYQLQMESALASALAPHPRSGGSTPGSAGTRSPAGDAAPDAAGSDSAPGDSQDLANALDRLRDARKALESGDQGNRGSTPGGDSSGDKGRTQGGGSSQPGALQGQAGSTTGNEDGDGTGGEGSDTGAGQGNPDAAAGSAPGTAPAPDIHGPPTPIQRGGTAPPEQARGNVGEGDTTSFLVRALPEWTGSKLPEDATRREYAQAAETALQRDEVPPKLKAAVRDYFTDIGMTAGGQPAAGNPPGTSSTNPPSTSEGGQ